MEGTNLRLMRDTLEDNGPGVAKNSALYLYVYPNVIVYQGRKQTTSCCYKTQWSTTRIFS